MPQRNPEAGEVEEGAVGGEQMLMTHQQPAELTKPGVGSLHNPTANTIAISAGLRISEILALRWSEIDWKNSSIRVTRAYVYGKFGPPKSGASKKPAPLRPLLATLLEAWRKETLYSTEGDLIFSSPRLKGRKPPRANRLVANHLQPAARKAGISGQVGFHNLRRTLARALVANGNHPKVVQELLRHSNIKTTLEVYARAMTPAKLDAQGWILR